MSRGAVDPGRGLCGSLASGVEAVGGGGGATVPLGELLTVGSGGRGCVTVLSVVVWDEYNIKIKTIGRQ